MSNSNIKPFYSKGYENVNLELIKVTTNEQGQKLVSARELYLGLGLNKAVWKRWYETNIIANEYFKENVDWVGFNIMLNGNETQDFAISLEFAKHIAMMARTEKSHEYRNYFIECEKVVHNPYAHLSKEFQAIIMHDEKIMKLERRVEQMEENAKLDPAEYSLVSKRVSSRVYEVQKERQMNLNKKQIGELFRALNRDILEITGVKTRTQLRQKHLNMVLDFINDWYPSRAAMFNINQMSLEI